MDVQRGPGHDAKHDQERGQYVRAIGQRGVFLFCPLHTETNSKRSFVHQAIRFEIAHIVGVKDRRDGKRDRHSAP